MPLGNKFDTCSFNLCPLLGDILYSLLLFEGTLFVYCIEVVRILDIEKHMVKYLGACGLCIEVVCVLETVIVSSIVLGSTDSK